MVKFMSYEDNYFQMCEKTGKNTVIYGNGVYGKRAFPYLKNVSYICDRHGAEMREEHGVKVITLKELEQLKEFVLVVICVKSEKARQEIKDELGKSSINGYVFDYFDNIAFPVYKEKTISDIAEKRQIRYIRLICDDKGWILNKFAVKMKKELEDRGYRCSIGHEIDTLADINHHIIYASCNPIVPHYNETFMITHIDSYNKVEFLKHQLRNARMGICMSRDTMERLASYGVPREKLCYINPAQDGNIKPKKYILGITHKTHEEDHRKSENALIDLCRDLDPDYFAFKIMGAGWEGIVDCIKKMGFQMDYYPQFDYEEYLRLMPSLDYYLYWGFDEGSMGYLDALRAGVETIVTPQGYHLDVKDGITYPCRTIPEFRDVLLELQDKRRKIVKSVESWTWKNFADKHLEVWNYLLGNEEEIYVNQHKYEDGIFSVLKMNV